MIFKPSLRQTRGRLPMRGTALLLAAGVCLAAAPQTPQQTPPPVFRGGTFLVPVDVRVLDKSGKPVTDLTQSDFTILEDSRPQEIRHFSSVTLSPNDDVLPLQRTSWTNEPRPQDRRVFLIVLGRGRLQPPSKGVDAAIHFVRNRLLPQDRVGVLAYNRSTDFTLDHNYIASVLERFLRRHESIEANLKMSQNIDVVYGITGVPRQMQIDIDQIFDVPGGPPLRTPPAGKIANAARLAQDERDARNAMISSMIGNAGLSSAGDAHALTTGFGEFVATYPQTINDLTALYRGIEYLRYIDGEKHLIFVTEYGMQLPRLEDQMSIAAVANDARVVIDTIQTGGLPEPALGVAPTFGQPTFSQRFAISSLKQVAELTGGQSSIYSYARDAVDNIATATRSSYLIGYAPTNTNFDGTYRRISIKVNRPGATVLYRHGYFGRDQLTAFDGRQAMTYERIAAATNVNGGVQDIKVSFNTTELRDRSGQALAVDIKIDPSRLSWTTSAADKLSEIDIAVFCGDAVQDMVGEFWQRANLRLPADVFERAKTAGINYSVRIPLKAQATYVQVVVYDYAADLVGSASKKLR